VRRETINSGILALRYPLRDVRLLARRQPVPQRLGSMGTAPVGHGPLARDAALATLEAFLMAADEPLTLRRLTALVRHGTAEEMKRQLRKLQGFYEAEDSALQIVELAGGYQLRTREELLPWLLKLRPAPDFSLTPAGRETLTMIAYRQPVTRAELESLRGVACGEVLRALLEKGLIRIVGRDTSLGRPVLYGTTKLFLQMVGLNSLQELPPLKS
jgi:segregation and condensation protein B